ncbi:MAG: glycoside hydrolase family 3 C-terminal domain-containing protein [Solirubrobacterales bacterium]|nr:glycoside hydrolase family 3 C-terminal domain-containing protein [Solirubrobacterales bacterium]MBV9716124.1 glycoside hydrolase family 3 C-terminal domain-containing protein [Solirubrobacterales bacterium]
MKRAGWWLRQPLFAVAALVALLGIAGSPSRAAGSPSYECSGATPIYLDTSYTFSERAADLMSCMSLGQEVLQLHTNSAPAIPSLGLQQYWYWNEGQHGVNTLNADTNAGGGTGGVHATSFPTNLATAMTWNPQLMYQETTAISDEVRGFLDPSLWGKAQNNLGPSPNDYGDLTFWAPTVNMDRDPRWGRTDEAFGEDPHLVSQMAGAYVEGYQGETLSGIPLSKYLKVAATAKHYALNNVEDYRTPGGSGTNDEDLRDYYTAQFRDLVEKAHVNGIMTSYNAINGTPSVADTYTANELLQRAYGFDGYTTADCGAVTTTYVGPPNGHDWAPPGWVTNGGGTNAIWTNVRNGKEIAGAAGGQSYAARAGTDLNCTGTEYTLPNIQQAIKVGVLDKGVLDTALTHVLTTRMQTGEFDARADVPWTNITAREIESAAHQTLARTVADNALVLLKNQGVPGTSTPLLPADPAKLSSVVIVGNLANTVTLGGYSGAPTHEVSAVQGITQEVKAANPNATIYYDSCATSTTATAPATCSAQTLSEMRNAGLVVVLAGTDAHVASEGHDRTTLAMPGNYDSMIQQVAAVGNPRMLLALQSDGPVQIYDVQHYFPAILFSGYNGQSQGLALADVMFGQQDPSGHLNFTWYKNDAQLPPIENYALTAAHTGGIGRTYMYFKRKPTYPFGYGLAYTTFAYSNLSVTPTSTTPDGAVTVSFDVTNTGKLPGATVAQLYVSPPSAPGIETPEEELEGFQRTAVLDPEQTQRITLSVPTSHLSRWDEKLLKEIVVDGAYQFKAGPDSAATFGSQSVQIHGTLTPKVSYVTVQPDQVIFEPGQTLDLTARNPWILDDTQKGNEQRHQRADGIVEAVNNDESFADMATAHVAYATSNPNVARVSANGGLTAVAAGVATITATVDGVTGGTPVVVQQPLALSSPSIVPAGTTLTATTKLPNTGTAPLTSVALTLDAPAGWRAEATSPTSFARLDGGQTAQTTWQVTVPAGTSAAGYELSARATFDDANGAGAATAGAGLSVPYSSLSAMFANPGITDDADTTPGNLDGGGQSYSEQTLENDGLSPGATVNHDGLSFTWPSAAPGTPDNVVARGQTTELSGSGKTLGFLATGDYGTATGAGTITYTDGTTQSFTLAFSDWYANSAQPGGDILDTFPYHNSQTGKAANAVSIYYQGIPLKAGKAIEYLTLPDVGSGVSSGQLAMHIFGVAIG